MYSSLKRKTPLRSKTGFRSNGGKKAKKEISECKKDLFAHHHSEPNRAERAIFPASVVKAAIERSGGICEYCRSARCTSTHHVKGRGGRDGRGVLTNAFRACGKCHIEIEGSEEKKQELISLYTERYGERFWFDEKDWDDFNMRQAAEREVEDARRLRMDALETIISLVSTAAWRNLNAAELRLLEALDTRGAAIFARMMHDVVGGVVPVRDPNSCAYGKRFED
ncbi:MAG: hypothetical protein JWM44_1318 [Bacilli bacterium]|nr:hypothetical protein [Bacilli bacterium]